MSEHVHQVAVAGLVRNLGKPMFGRAGWSETKVHGSPMDGHHAFDLEELCHLESCVRIDVNAAIQ